MLISGSFSRLNLQTTDNMHQINDCIDDCIASIYRQQQHQSNQPNNPTNNNHNQKKKIVAATGTRITPAISLMTLEI